MCTTRSGHSKCKVRKGEDRESEIFNPSDMRRTIFVFQDMFKPDLLPSGVFCTRSPNDRANSAAVQQRVN